VHQQLAFSPVELRYVAALRGLVPPAPPTAFTYGGYGEVAVESALCLAASNPEGRFYFILPTAAEAATAQAQVMALRLPNCQFVSLPTATLPPLDYLCVDLGMAHTPEALVAAQQLAAQLVAAGGIFACRYAPFAQPQDALGFMLGEFVPELPATQLGEFLHELKQLGPHYFANHPTLATVLDDALGKQNPALLLQRFTGLPVPPAAAVQMVAAMVPAGFSFVGDALVQANYLELMVPQSAQDVLYNLRGHLLYEAIKDFSTARATRTDVWVKQPRQTSSELADLFGSFAFGRLDNRPLTESSMRWHGQTLDISTPLFTKLLEVMAVLPMTIGDFLSHPAGADCAPTDVVMALHALVAFGVAAPMRGHAAELGVIDTHYPMLAGYYNQQLRTLALQAEHILIASPVAGRPVHLTLSEALVLQAIGKVGLAESADALLPELQRIAADPFLAQAVFSTGGMPEADFTERLIKQVCTQQLVDWYALGIVQAA
jgi:hypothetical protein